MRYPASDPLLTCLEVVWIDAKGSGRKKKTEAHLERSSNCEAVSHTATDPQRTLI